MKKEEKLILGDIVGYLPHNIECILSPIGRFNLDSELGTPYEATQPMKITNVIIGDKVEIEIHSEKTNWGVGLIELEEITLILKPFSEFKKEIEGYNIDCISKYIGGAWCDIYDGAISHILDNEEINIKALPLFFIEYFYENRYDFKGLISRGLAVDINTLKD